MKVAERPPRLAVVLAAAVVLSAGAFRAQEPPAESEPATIAGQAALTGQILARGKPVAGAVVHAYHIDTGALYSSEATTPSGKFRLTGLQHGYLDLAVEIDGGLYSANQVINLPPSGKLAVELDLVAFADRPVEYRSQAEAAAMPGVAGEPTGVAELAQKLRGRDFWRSPKGIAILSGIGGGAVLAIALGSNDEETFTISPVVP